MRKESVDVKSRKKASDEMPWASKIIKVEGGYMGFECVDEFERYVSPHKPYSKPYRPKKST